MVGCILDMWIFRYKGLFIISRKGVHCWGGGYLFLTRFPRGGGMNIFRCRGVGIHFFINQKKNMAECHFGQFPCHPGCPHRLIHPCCPEKLLVPREGYTFLQRHQGGYQNFAETRGGRKIASLQALFLKSSLPSKKKFLIVPSSLGVDFC